MGGHLTRLLVLWLCTFLIPPAQAQQLEIRSYGVEEGLGAPQVWSIFQDSRGVIWIGTESGVTRYDGVDFTTLSVENGLPDSLVRGILESPDGHLWFATNAGLAEYDGRSIRRVANESGISEGAVWAGVADARGHLWFASQDHGVIRYDGRHFRAYTQADGLPTNHVYNVFASRSSVLWLGTRDHGAVRIRIDENGIVREVVSFGPREGLESGAIRAIVEDEAGNVYLGVRGRGVFRFDGQSFTGLPSAALSGIDVYSLLVNASGELVIGTVDGGVSICRLPDLSGCRWITKKNGLRTNAVYALFEDRERVLWIGLNDGVANLSNENLRTFTESEGLPNNAVHAIHTERDGVVWLATLGGLARYSPGPGPSSPFVFTKFMTKDGLPSDGVWDVHRDRGGTLWVATRNGLARYREGKGFDVFTVKDGMPNNYVYDLFEDSQGRVWMATLDGVSMLEVDGRGNVLRFKNYTRKEGLSASQIYCLGEDEGGRIWIGTASNGLDVFDGHAFRNYSSQAGLGSGAVLAIFRDHRGTMWVGTSGGGLAKYVKVTEGEGVFVKVPAEAGLGSSQVVAIEEDRSGLLWIGTSKGVVAFDPERRRRDGGEGTVMHRFDRKGGMRTANALAVSPEGDLWFGISRGVVQIKAPNEPSLRVPPLIGIKEVRIGGMRILRSPYSAMSGGDFLESMSRAIEIPHAQNAARIEFRCPSFREGQETRFQYRLEGFDHGWSGETTTPFKEYTNLGAGKYTFLVRGRAGDGTWSEEAARFAFIVLPPFWETWWARVAAVLFGALLILASHRLRMRAIVVRNRDLEAVVIARTEELAEYSLRLEAHANELEGANQRILDADKTKNRFFAAMSHELRTPLNAIIGFSEILTTRMSERATPRELGFIHNVLESGRHLLNLINNLLDLSKIEEGKMEVHVDEVVMSDLVDGVLNVLDAIASRRRISLESTVGSEFPVQRIDGPKLKQILYNLVSNAIKFSPDGSSVVIGARLLLGEESPLGVESAEVSVKDCGPGIRPEDQGLIFEEFRQTTAGAQSEGTGLGLAIVRRLAEIQGGRVTVESVVGAGSTFSVVLPSVVREILHSDVELRESSPGEESSEPHTILIVEDDAEFADSLARNLEAAGYRTVSTRRGEDVLRIAREISPSTITLDVVLPGVDGWEVLRQLRGDPDCSRIPVVIISAFGNRELGLALGADEQFEKPLDPALLAHRIRALLPAAGLRREAILLIEDDPGVQRDMKSILSESSYEIHCTESGDTGVRLANMVHPALIVLDLMMPGVNPFEVAARLQEDPSTRSIPLVILTPRELGPDVREELLRKMRDQLRKGPVPTSRMTDTIRELDRRQSARPAAQSGTGENDPQGT